MCFKEKPFLVLEVYGYDMLGERVNKYWEFRFSFFKRWRIIRDFGSTDAIKLSQLKSSYWKQAFQLDCFHVAFFHTRSNAQQKRAGIIISPFLFWVCEKAHPWTSPAMPSEVQLDSRRLDSADMWQATSGINYARARSPWKTAASSEHVFLYECVNVAQCEQLEAKECRALFQHCGHRLFLSRRVFLGVGIGRCN